MPKSRKNAVNTVSVKEKLGSFRLPVHQAISVSVDGKGKIEFQNVNNYFNSMTITKEELNMLNLKVFGEAIDHGIRFALTTGFLKAGVICSEILDDILGIAALMVSKGHGPEHAEKYINEWVLNKVESK